MFWENFREQNMPRKKAGKKEPLAMTLPTLAVPKPKFPSGARVVGIDEVGRGCLAGPVAACAVVLPDGFALDGLDDSKKLTPEMREHLFPILQSSVLAWGLGVASPRRIDEINILQATFEAMAKALANVLQHFPRAELPDIVLVDGNKTIPDDILSVQLAPVVKSIARGSGFSPLPAHASLFRQRCLIKGDSLSPAISAASVLAKVWRDRLMDRLARRWPGYGFEKHKGYGTADHYAALAELGPCPAHRLSFKGVTKDKPADEEPCQLLGSAACTLRRA